MYVYSYSDVSLIYYTRALCWSQGSNDFIVDLVVTHVPMYTSNFRPKTACQVLDLRSQAVPSSERKVDLSLND